ncbi:MAG TPA: hypothetical protein VGM44_07935 [Polyangiaceae bacterium]|jgi:hypothetical protein
MIRRLLTGTFVVSILCGAPRAARAYDYGTHAQIAERAAFILQNPPITSPPAGSPAGFADFLDAVKAAPNRLGVLHTGLPQGLQQSSFISANQDQPFPIDPSNHYDCPVFDKDNLSALDKYRIEDFFYTVTETPNPCGVVPAASIPDNPVVLRSILGWHAGSVDNHLDDVVLWARPQNAPGVKQINQLAEDALDLGVGTVFAALSCIGSIFGLSDCDPSSSFASSKDDDPLRAVNNALPGLGSIRSSQFTGLWHFEQVAQENPVHEYNDHRGMWYPGAGPNGVPGAVDVAIMDATMIAGLSLNASESTGVSEFGQFDQVRRTDDDWQSDTMGNIEFSPLHNLAKYGWELYRQSGFTDAAGLAYPLHALGDATVPHHVAGTTSYGHRPYEDYVNNHTDALMGAVSTDDTAPIIQSDDDVARDTRILTNAFDFWQQLHRTNGDIQALVLGLAVRTYGMVQADGPWAFQDAQSVNYLVPSGTTALGVTIVPGNADSANATQFYDQFKSFMPKYLELSISASIGFLAFAAEQAHDTGPDPERFCPGESEYNLTDLKCEDNFAPPPPPMLPVILDICTNNGSCDGGTGGSAGGGSGGGGPTQCGPEGMCPNCPNADDSCDPVTGCCEPTPR